jgi:hypothetical protein
MSNSATSIRRVLVIGLIASVMLFTHVSTGGAVPNAYDFQIAAKKSGVWKGIDVDLIMFDPGLQANSNKFVAAPVALTTYWTSAIFIEIGPIKTCYANQTCQLRPYYSYATNTASGFSEDTTRLLASGGNYGYKVDKTNVNNEFQAIFCSGGGGGAVWTQNMGRNDFPYVFTALETTGGARLWPPIKISSPQAKDANGAWGSWCFDSINTTHPDGKVVPNPCVPSNNGWELRSGYQAFIPIALKD